MKHIKMSLTLTAIIIVVSLLIVGVNALTEPIIQDNNAKEAHATKFEVLPELSESDNGYEEPVDDYDFEGTNIDNLWVIDNVGYIYQATYTGYASDVTYMFGVDTDGNVTGFKVLNQNETPGYGAKIGSDDFAQQFSSLTVVNLFNGEFDGISGATVTSEGLKGSMVNVTRFHQEQFQGIVSETKEEKQERLINELFTEADSIVDVSEEYTLDADVENIFEVFDESENYLGVAYFVNTVGASVHSTTYIEFILGINADNTFAGLKLFDDSETPGYASPFYEDSYDDSLIGDDASSTTFIDDVAGSTLTKDALQDAITALITYHNDVYLTRAEPTEADLTDLQTSYPSAEEFQSIYLDYPESDSIINLYEALDSDSQVIGYVYFLETDAYGGDIQILIGFDTSGTTQVLHIVNHSESWDMAEQYAGYDGSQGYFPDTPWLDNFESISLDTLQTDINSESIDTIAGVTVTTSNILQAIQEMIQYHNDNITGS